MKNPPVPAGGISRITDMHFNALLSQASHGHRSLLCVGLDPDPARFPAGMKGDSRRIFDFCARIVDATKDLVNAFKPQIAYFAAHRAEDQLEQLMAYMRSEEHTSELHSH